MRTWHKSRAEAIMERKLRLVKEEASIVLSPKMREMHLLTQMLFTADKAINRMRMDAGTHRMPLAELEAASGRIVKFTQKRCGASRAPSGGRASTSGFGFDPREKEILARRRNAYVFMPKTTEGATLANLFISLDSAYCEFKIKSPLHEIARLGLAIETMRGLVREFHEFTSDLAQRPASPTGSRTAFSPTSGARGSRRRSVKTVLFLTLLAVPLLSFPCVSDAAAFTRMARSPATMIVT